MASLNSSQLRISADDRYQAMVLFGADPIIVQAARASLCYAPIDHRISKVAIAVTPALDRPDARAVGQQKGLIE